MNLSSALLSVLGAFRARVASEVNSGLLVTLDDHIAQIAAVVDNDVQAAEDKAHEVLGALYTALHGAPAAAPAPAVAAPIEGTLAAPLQADPAATAAAAPSAPQAPAAPASGGKA